MKYEFYSIAYPKRLLMSARRGHQSWIFSATTNEGVPTGEVMFHEGDSYPPPADLHPAFMRWVRRKLKEAA